ncbi:hypothetical protein PT974_12274 [Cladobotryum mycophilum]|uniref:Uncharacterized protein n=1 Tax=Cladobotryum mycophilum TaxID=491253 RepID=A0ABR0S7J1_9HYPO
MNPSTTASDGLSGALLHSANSEEIEMDARLIDALFITATTNSPSRIDDGPDQASMANHSDFGQSVANLFRAVNSPPSHKYPLLALNEKIEAFFKYGPGPAFFIFSMLSHQVVGMTDEPRGQLIKIDVTGDQDDSTGFYQSQAYLWKSCKMAATFILTLASPNDLASLYASQKWKSRRLGGLPTLTKIKQTPSASLSESFQRAKAAALGEGKTTVIGVTLTDVHIFEL